MYMHWVCVLSTGNADGDPGNRQNTICYERTFCEIANPDHEYYKYLTITLIISITLIIKFRAYGKLL